MSGPTTVVLDHADAVLLRALMHDYSWPGSMSEAITRIRTALAHATEVDDEHDHAMVPQADIGAADFLDH